MKKTVIIIASLIVIGLCVYLMYQSSRNKQDQQLSAQKRVSLNQLKSTQFIEPLTGTVYVSSHIVITGETTAPNIKLSLLCNGKMVSAQNISSGKFTLKEIVLEPGVTLISGLLEDNYNQQYVLAGPALKYIPASAHDYDFVKTTKKMVALTFDGDEESSGTLALLDVLKEKDLKCTIFITGHFIRLFPKIVQRLVEDGHEVGNHSSTHPHLMKISTSTADLSFVQPQLEEPARLFKQLTGKNMAPFWRAPFGEYNRQILRRAAEYGYLHVRWSSGLYGKNGSLDSLDWVGDPKHEWYLPSNKIVERILTLADKGIGGGIILMHLGSSRKEEDRFYHYLPDLIDGLRQQGYTLVTVSDLIISSIEDKKLKKKV